MWRFRSMAIGLGLLSAAPAWATPCGTSLPGQYFLAFLGCDHAAFNCLDPMNHRVYLAQSNDGASWSLVPGWQPYPGSVPDVIRRGKDLYVYTPGQVRRYRGATGTWESPVPVTLSDPAANNYVDPSMTVDGQGRLVMFYLLGILGQDPAQCAPLQTTCTKHFHSATEVAGSDGTAFAVNPGDRVTVTIGNPGSASDPDIYSDHGRFILYVSRGQSVQAFTSTALHGVYVPIPSLPNGGILTTFGGVPAGYFDPLTARYWTYVQNGNIQRATHASLDAPIPSSSFVPVVDPVAIGLGPTFEIGSPSFAINAPTVAPEAFGLAVAPAGPPDPGTTISWAAFPNATSYDVIRGDIAALACATDHVDAGIATCIADNTTATSVGDLPGTPGPGGGFYYLARPNVPVAKGSYGYSPSGGERVPSGGCP